MLKKLCLLNCLLGCILFSSSCTAQNDSSSQIKEAFFAWTEGYIALAQGESWTFCLSYYFPEFLYDHAFEEAISVELQSDSDISVVMVEQFHRSDSAMPAQQNGIAFKGLYLTVSATQQGQMICNALLLHQPDGSIVRRSFGEITFDVGPAEPDTPAFDTWSGPAIASSPESFAYAWGQKNVNAQMLSIQYGNNQFITDPSQLYDAMAVPQGLPVSATFLLDSYQAPLVYIKAKITVQTPMGTHIEYAKGCYCGSDFDANDIALSLAQNGATNS